MSYTLLHDVALINVFGEQINPDVYLAAQASFGFGHREVSLSRTTSLGTSVEGDMDTSRSSTVSFRNL